MNIKLISSAFSLLIFTISSPIDSREPYDAKVRVNSDSARVYAPNINNLINQLHSSQIESLIPSYTPTSAVALNFNLRGIPS